MRDDIETGDQFLLFSGDILAPNGALARAKLNTLRSATLGIYGFTEVQRTRGGSQARAISANGDKTNVGGDTAALQGLEEKGDMDDASFIRLTFNEEYRRRIPGNIVSSQFQINTHDDTTSGMVVTVYSGTIHATGATADAALAAARARADEFGADREASIDTTAFLKSHVETVNQRQLTADNPVEFVSLQFSFEYQSRMAAGRGYLEFSTALQTEAFGADTVTVSGYATGRNWAEAELMYQTNVRAAYATALIRNENLTEHQTQAARSSTPTAVQQTRVDFSFTAHKDKPAGKVAAKYSISISRDFLQLTKRSKVRGSVFALTPKMADAFATALTAAFGLGAVTASERSEDHDWFGSGGSEIVSTPILTSFIGGSTPVTTPITVTSFSGADAFMKLDFDDSFEDRLTGISSVIEMRVTESVQFSGTRWALQPLPFDSNGTGGISIAQPAGMAEGSRTVRGTVTAGTQAAALAWARRHRTLLTGDADGNKIYQPESIETEYEFAPRQDGIISGEGQNVRLFRVNFTFAEILPNYPPPA
jgi:hypothetical protein